MYKSGKVNEAAEGLSALNRTASGKVVVPNAERSAKSGRQGERTDPKVEDAIYAALVDRPQMKSAALYREFEDDPDLAPLLPGLRAFRGLVAGIREHLDRGRWEPAQMVRDDDAQLVLEVIGAATAADYPRWEGTRQLLEDETDPAEHRALLAKYAARVPNVLEPYWPTPRVAHWIARVRRWVPGLQNPTDYIWLAVRYAAREAREDETGDLDRELAGLVSSQWPKEKQT
jgi:hypothetical protein